MWSIRHSLNSIHTMFHFLHNARGNLESDARMLPCLELQIGKVRRFDGHANVE